MLPNSDGRVLVCLLWPVVFVTSAPGPSLQARSLPAVIDTLEGKVSTSATISGAGRQQMKLQEHGFMLSSEEIPC